MMFSNHHADYTVEGEAIDQETILRLRPEIESHVSEEIEEFPYTELFWNLKDSYEPEGPFVYQIRFYREQPVDNVEGTD